MYTGHAAIALALAAQEPQLPIVPLTIACYGPDWLEALIMVSGGTRMAPYTHSIPAVIIGATFAAGLYAALASRSGARWLLLGWMLHWPADFLTGLKPLSGTGDALVGLHLYDRPLVDFVLESVVIGVGCTLYARAYAIRAEQRRLVIGVGAVLMCMQGLMDVSLR